MALNEIVLAAQQAGGTDPMIKAGAFIGNRPLGPDS